MIVNPSYFIKNPEYKCNKYVMEYLVFEKSIPMMGLDSTGFYFKKNDVLEECLENMPLHLKFLSIF